MCRFKSNALARRNRHRPPHVHVIWMGDSPVLLPHSSLQSAQASKTFTLDSFRKAFAPVRFFYFKK
jgi:hypothetical protein